MARFTSVVAVVGIAVGVASLIMAQALARGFQQEMRDKILSNTAHVSVFFSDGAEISSWREVSKNLKKLENVEKIEPTAYKNSIIAGKDAVSYAILRVQAKSEEKPNKVAIGARLAERIGAKIGDEVEIITVENQSEPKRSKVFVGDIFQTGLFEYDSTWISVSPENFAAMSGQVNFTPTFLSVSVKDIYATDETAREMREILGESFRVVDWQEANQPLFAALSLERKVSLAIISLIIFIAALNITTTLALLVNERKFDIAVLRTCGAKTKSLIFIFLVEGLILGFLGIFFGVVLGLFGCFLGNRFRLINLSAEVYSLSYIPLRPDFLIILLIIFIAFILCLAATVYPAFRASRLKPLENLRSQ